MTNTHNTNIILLFDQPYRCWLWCLDGQQLQQLILKESYKCGTLHFFKHAQILYPLLQSRPAEWKIDSFISGPFSRRKIYRTFRSLCSADYGDLGNLQHDVVYDYALNLNQNH